MSGRPASISARCAASWNCPSSSRPRRSRRPTRRRRRRHHPAPTAPTSRSSRSTRPTSRDLDQAVHLARRRRRLPRPLRDRRRGRVRTPGRRARRGDLAPRPDRLPARRQRAAAPDRCSARAPRACCPTSTARRCCGRSTSTPPATPSTSGWSAPACAAAPSSTTPACRRPSTPARLPEPLALLPEIGALLIERGPGAAARSTCRCPSRTWSPTTAAAGSCCAAPAPVEEFNAQISLLTGMAAARSCSTAASACCARCRRRAATPSSGSARPRRALRRRLAGRDVAGRVIASRRPRRPARRRVPRPGRRADARRRVHGVRRCRRPSSRPRWRRRAVRPCDGAAAPPRRPVRDRGLPGAPRTTTRRAGVGTRGAAEAAGGDGDSDRVANAAERGAVDLTEAVLLAGRVGRDGSRRPWSTSTTEAQPASRAARSRSTTRRCARAARATLPLGERMAVGAGHRRPAEADRALRAGASPGARMPAWPMTQTHASRRLRPDRRHPRRHRRPGPGPGLPAGARRPAGAHRLARSPSGPTPRRRRSRPCRA